MGYKYYLAFSNKIIHIWVNDAQFPFNACVWPINLYNLLAFSLGLDLSLDFETIIPCLGLSLDAETWMKAVSVSKIESWSCGSLDCRVLNAQTRERCSIVWVEIGLSGVQALPFAAGRNLAGHYFHYFSHLSILVVTVVTKPHRGLT